MVVIQPATVSGGQADGIVLLYHNVPPYAATVMEHVNAFVTHSRFAVWAINVDHGYPPVLDELSPRIILLHYSLFGTGNYTLNARYLQFLERSSDTYRIAFFQDEYQHCGQRFAFIDRHRIDCVYTLLEPAYHDLVYGRHTHGPRVIYTIPGYVSDHLVRTAERRSIPDAERRIDIGYRGRSLPFYMGRGSQEKREIALRFAEMAKGRGLVLDLAVDERSRLYGDRWTSFMANSRGFIGVEAGVSIFDIDDRVQVDAEQMLRENPAITMEELSANVLEPWEGNIPYRTISPRHFEASAFRVAQILFEGRYSGILEPMVHYLPLRKDFSNFDEVIGLFKDPEVRRSLTDRAYADLIASGRFSYREFVRQFDEDLEVAGIRPTTDPPAVGQIGWLIRRGTTQGRWRSELRPYYRRLVPFRVRRVVHEVASGIRALVRPGLRRP